MKRIEIIGVDTSSLPKISGEESRQYLLEIKNGNEEKKNEFINANIRLVLSIVQRFSNGRGEADDLFDYRGNPQVSARKHGDKSQPQSARRRVSRVQRARAYG